MISIIVSILSFLTPIFFLNIILNSSDALTEENFETNCSSLYDEYGKDLDKVLYNMIFLIRMYIFAVCLLFLGSSPYMQLCVNSLASFLPFLYIIQHKPFRTKSDNILNGFTEGCIFIEMTLLFACLKDMSKDREYYYDWALVILLYISFLVPVAYQTLMSVWNILKKFISPKEEKVEEEKVEEEKINEQVLDTEDNQVIRETKTT